MRYFSFLLALLILFFSFQSLQAQGPYKYRLSTEITIPAVGLGTALTGFFLAKNKETLTEAQIRQLNKSDIWGIDRHATRNWSTGSALASDVLMIASYAAPLTLLADNNMRRDGWKLTAIYAETAMLSAGLTFLTKELVKRNRPFTYNSDAPLHKKQKKDARSSFFSGHTSSTASNAFFMAKVYADYYPNSKWKPLVWSSAAAVPLATGVLRYTAGKHFLTDIITGYLVGAAVGVLVPHLHRIDIGNRKP
ncbi:MAG: phosphatase PAP2 family protein [Chitinophagales bacterium]